MATKIYDIPAGYIEKLEDAFYDVESYKNIMIELLQTPTSNNYQYSILDDFRKNYKDALIIYDKEKTNFELAFVKAKHPDATFWNVTFGDNKVEIKYPD